MISFYEIYGQSIALFDDPKITEAYDLNKISFAKMMYPFLNSSLSLFTNPSMIGRMLVDYEEPLGLTEVFDSDGKTNTFELSLNPTGNDMLEFKEDGKIVEAEYDANKNKVTFPNILEVGKTYSVECYNCGYFKTDLSVTGNKSIDADIKSKTISIIARLLVLSWGEKTKNFLLDIENLLTDTDFNIHPASSALKSKIEFVNQLNTGVYQLQNKLAHIIRFARIADWGRRYN